MKQILEVADNYMKNSGWEELALIKFCMCAVGVLIGLTVCSKHKKVAGVIAAVIFIVTLIPLIMGLLKSMEKK